MFADLHIHSNHSDGTNTPKEIVEIAKQNEVYVLALCDHDTVDGIEEFIYEAKKKDIISIPAVEISTSVEGVRIHILGYYIDYNNRKLKDFLNDISIARTKNTKDILKKNIKLGRLKYSWDNVLMHNKNKKWICSSHVFEAMKKDGIYNSWQDWAKFYNKYFSKNSGVYIDIEGFSTKEAIDIILEAEGIPVVAHPKLIGDDRQLFKLIKYGIKGIEVYYPAHKQKDIKRYITIAEKNDLIITGGTDWHGDLTEWDVKLGDYGIKEEQIKKLKR